MDTVENSENPWPEEFSELKSVEESLTCGICYEYIQTAVMTPCSHNYCTLCIRRYLNFKNECPACFNQVHDTDLRVNRTLDNIKHSFLKVRENLKLCMKGLPIRPEPERRVAAEHSSPVKSRVNQIMSTPKSSSRSPSGLRNEELTTPVRANRVNQVGSSPQTPNRIDSTPHAQNIQKHLFSPSTSGIAPIFNNTVKVKVFSKKDDIGPTVPCPVCSVNVSETHINRHLDDCLKRQNNTSGPVSLEQKLKPIPKLVFNLMKDSELRRRLKEFGISTVGDSKALKGRLNKFCILYNAERDKTVQRPIAEIVKQCEDEEQLEKKVTLSNTGNVLAFSKPQVVKPVKGQNDNYCEANKSSFDKLIEQVRKRNPKKKKSATEEERGDLSSLYEDLVSETLANVSNDSDSGTSGHQQRYSNDGPTISESDSAVESNRIVDLTDADTNLEENEKQTENIDIPFASLIEEIFSDSDDDALNPVINKRSASHTFDGDSNSVSNPVNSEKSATPTKKPWTFKKPRMSKPSFENDIQELNELLESVNDDEELKDISLNVTNESVNSNPSKVAENEEELESDMNNSEENCLGVETCDKENTPLCEEIEKSTFQRPARKRSRPHRYSDSEEKTPTKSNQFLQNVLLDSATYEVALDGSLDEVESSPEKILKRRRGRPKSNTESESEPETPTRVLRRRPNHKFSNRC